MSKFLVNDYLYWMISHIRITTLNWYFWGLSTRKEKNSAEFICFVIFEVSFFDRQSIRRFWIVGLRDRINPEYMFTTGLIISSNCTRPLVMVGEQEKIMNTLARSNVILNNLCKTIFQRDAWNLLHFQFFCQ